MRKPTVRSPSSSSRASTSSIRASESASRSSANDCALVDRRRVDLEDVGEPVADQLEDLLGGRAGSAPRGSRRAHGPPWSGGDRNRDRRQCDSAGRRHVVTLVPISVAPRRSATAAASTEADASASTMSPAPPAMALTMRRGRRRAVADDADAVDAEQHGAAVGVGVEWLVERRAGPAAARRPPALSSALAANALEQGLDERLDAALERLQHDVAGEPVGDDDVDVVGHEVAALDVADEVDAAAPSPGARRSPSPAGCPCSSSSPIDSSPTRGLGDAEALPGEHRAHLGELHEPLGLALGVGAGVEQHGRRARPAPGSAWRSPGRLTPLMRPMRSSADAIVAPVLPARHHRRRLAVADRLGRPHERRVLLAADALRRVGVHRDDLGGRRRPRGRRAPATRPRADRRARPGCRARRRPARRPSTISPGRPVAAHGVDGDGQHATARDDAASVDVDGLAALVPAAVAAHDVRHAWPRRTGGRCCGPGRRASRPTPGGCGSSTSTSSSWGRPSRSRSSRFEPGEASGGDSVEPRRSRRSRSIVERGPAGVGRRRRWPAVGARCGRRRTRGTGRRSPSAQRRERQLEQHRLADHGLEIERVAVEREASRSRRRASVHLLHLDVERAAGPGRGSAGTPPPTAPAHVPVTTIRRSALSSSRSTSIGAPRPAPRVDDREALGAAPRCGRPRGRAGPPQEVGDVR